MNFYQIFDLFKDFNVSGIQVNYITAFRQGCFRYSRELNITKRICTKNQESDSIYILPIQAMLVFIDIS